MQVEEDVISSFVLEDCKLKRRPELEATVGCGCIWTRLSDSQVSLIGRKGQIAETHESPGLSTQLVVVDSSHGMTASS